MTFYFAVVQSYYWTLCCKCRAAQKSISVCTHFVYVS